MARKVEYKYKPYEPTKFKKKTGTDIQKQLEGLRKQRENLDTRLRNEGINPDNLGGEFDNRNFLEKALNLTPDQGVLFDFFEAINRPVEAVKAGIVAGVDGQNILEAAWSGLSGETVTAGGDVLEKFGVDFGDSKVAEFVEDVAVDIVLDPLNLIPSGYFLKKFGGAFMRSKSKILRQFAGQLLDTFSKIKKVDGTDYIFNNLDELDDFLKNAPVEEIEHIQRQLDNLAVPTAGSGQWNGEVFEQGTRYDGTGFEFKNNFEQLKQRAEKLKEFRDKIDEVEDLYKKGRLTKQQRVDKINEILPGSFRSGQTVTVDGADVFVRQIRESVLTEMNLYDDALEIAKRYGDEYDAILNKTSNRVDDVTIVRKIQVGDKTYYIKTLGIEAKTAKQFYLKTATLALNDAGNVILKETPGATPYSQGIKDRIEAIMNKRAKGRGKPTTVGNKIKKALQQNKTVNFADLMDEVDQKDVRKLFVDMYREAAGIAPDKPAMIYFGGANRKGFFMDLADAEEYLDLTKMRAGMADGQFRLLGNTGIDLTSAGTGSMNGLEVLISEGKVFASTSGISNLIERADNLVDVNRTAQVNIFEFYQDKPGLIGDFSRVGVKFINFMKEKFSAFGFLTSETAAAARRLKGETAVQYQTRMLRLANLRDSFKKQFPKISDRYLAELIESGAHIDANNVITFADRTVTVKDYLRTLVDAANNGNPGMLRKFARGKESQFLNTLNEIGNQFAGTTGEVYFDVIEKRGVKLLQTEFDSAELKKILTELDVDGGLGLGVFRNDILDYGKYNLLEDSLLKISDDAQTILKEWEGYAEFVGLNNDVQRILVQEGGFSNFLDHAGNVSDTYLRHIMTKQAYEYMSKNQPGVLSKFAKPGSQFFKERRYLGSIEEVNDYFKAIYDLDMEVFDPSAFRAAEDFFKHAFRNVEQGKLMSLLLRSQDKYGEGLLRVVDNTREVAKQIGAENIVFKNFREEFPQLVKNLSNEQMAALEAYLVGFGYGTGNKAISMNRTMHRVIKEAEKAFKGLDDLTMIYDKFLNTWKGLTLVTPGFHLRNLFGNMFNSYVAGMDTIAQLKYTRIGMLELDDFDKAVKELANNVKFSDLPQNLQKAYNNVIEFQKNGLIQSHRGVRDLEQLKEASELGAEGATGVRKAYNNIIRMNFNIAEKIDDTQRYILYRWGLDKFGDSQKAAKVVTDSLFDYSALTGFEKDVMKRLFPFYTFMKNNFIFHSKNILANPKYYARTGRAYKYYLEDIAGYGVDDLPDYTTESMWLPIPMMVTKNDKAGVAFLKANLPITDFVELVQNPFEKGVQSVTVPIKLMIEIGSGRDMFTGQPITEFPGEKNVMEKGTGVLSELRNQRGQLTIAQTPLAQKILNDIGFRTPLSFGTTVLDTLDTILGYQGPQSGFSDFLERAGVASVQESKKLELTTLYQELERLRELKDIYEQETGNQLPPLPRG